MELCYDIMEMIGKEYTIIKETNKNKKLYGEIVKHLKYYFDEHGMYEEKHGIYGNPWCFKNGDIRLDTEFLEYEELWNTNHYKIICNKHGGKEEYDEWCNNDF
jgi:hypothetical protein